MKHRKLWARGLEVSSTIFLLFAGSLEGVAETEKDGGGVLLDLAPTNRATALPPAASTEAPVADTDAPIKLVSEDKPLPANIRPSSPVAEVIKLANSGVDESVMMTFVTNSVHTFNLGAEEIIYLNDIGVPGGVVTAMIQRDGVLKTSLALAAAGPPPAAPSVPEATQMSANWPAPNQVAPQPATGSASEPVEAPLTPPDAAADSMFYDSLAPYGNWVDVSGYGVCWQPTAVVVNAGWQPYYNCGHWVYSDCGWYWRSDYSWGWGPFHYGSWFRHGHLGWCWVPGRVWGPSWVSWRYNDHFCGWAPLPPGAAYHAGVGLTYHGHHVGEREDFGLSPGHYRFVGWDQFHDRQFRGPVLSPQEKERVFVNSTVSTRITGDNQTIINNGLPVSRVAAATHRAVQTVALRESSNQPLPGAGAERFEAGGRTLNVYRPDPALAERNARSQTRTASAANRAATPGSTPAPGSPWSPRSGTAYRPPSEARPGMGQSSSLILRGSQPAAAHETPPPNSLVVIGRRDGSAPSAPSQPWAPSSTSAASAPSAHPDGNNRQLNPRTAAPVSPMEARVQTTVSRPAANQNPQHDWRGTVTSSPQPEWFTRSPSASQPRANSSVGVTVPEARSYQPAPRMAAPEVPRYAPSPSYTAPQRSYSAPAAAAPARTPSVESRPAPSAPSAAPAAPAASHSAPTTSSSRGSNR